MKNIAKQILVIAMMILGAMGAWAQTAPTKQSNGTWKFTMPAGNRTLRTTWKQEIGLAWKIGEDVVNSVSGYLGFENAVTFPELYFMNSDIAGQFLIHGRYGSSEPTIATIDNNGNVNFVSSGVTTIYAVYNDDNYYDSVYYTLTVDNPYTLTLGVNNSNWGSVALTPISGRIIDNGSSTYKVYPNTEVTVNAAANSLHFVSGWEDELHHTLATATYSNYTVTSPENKFPSNSTLTLTVTGDTTTKALFGINDYVVRASVAEGQNERGTVQIAYTDGDNHAQTTATTATVTSVQATALGGSQSTVTATPAYGYVFNSWDDNVTSNQRTTTSAANYTANFGFDQFTVSAVVADGQNAMGSVSGDATVDYLSNVTLTATYNPGYHFVKWTEGTADFSTSPNILVPATSNRTLVAHFAENPTLTLVADGEGTVVIDGNPSGVLSILNDNPQTTSNSYSVYPGTIVTIIANPSDYSYMKNWDNETALNSNVPVNKVVTVDENTTITAHFAQKPRLTLATNNSNGTVAIDGATLPANVTQIGSTSSYYVDYNTSVAITATADLEHYYHFENWTNEEGTEYTTDINTDTEHGNYPQNSLLNLTVTGDTTTQANFQLNSYTITFNTNGGSEVPSITQNYNTAVTAPANPTREGYTFNGWSPAVPAMMPASNTECVAQWTENSYTVTFNNGGHGTVSVGGTTVADGGTASVNHFTGKTLVATASTGYTFSGWSTTGSVAIADANDASTTITATGTGTVTANWTANTYTVTLNNQSATTAGSASVTATYESSALPSIINPQKEGYTFGGWYSGEGGTGALVINTSGALQTSTAYTNASGQWTSVSDQTLYAKWNIVTYSISYELDGGSVATANPTSYTVESEDITLTNPTRTGYGFTGWTGTGLDGATSTVTIAHGSTGDRSYTATWTPNTNTAYKVYHYTKDLGATTYTQNGDIDNLTGTSDASVTLSGLKRTITGFTYDKGFAGTTTSATMPDATTAVTETTILPDGSRVISLYYSRDSHNVTLASGTGIANVTGAGTYEYGASVSINATLSNGYDWSKWTQTNGGADVTATQAHTFTMGTSNIAYTANATAHSYAITYELAGGSVATANPTSYTIETPDITLTNPTRTGYGFTGWTGTGLDGATSTVTIAHGSTGDRSYTATWTPNTNTAYKVYHYTKDLGATTYTQNGDVDNLTGTSDASVTLSGLKRTITGFTYDKGFAGTTINATMPDATTAVTETTILPDGSRVISLYYSRDSHNVTLASGTGIANVTGAGTYEYGASVSINATLSNGYDWSKWTQTNGGADVTATQAHTFTMGTSDIAYTANATAHSYAISYELAGGSVATANPTTYTIETPDITLTNPTRTGYGFAGWTGTDLSSATQSVTIAHGSTGDRSYTATWTPNTNTAYKVYHYTKDLGATTYTQNGDIDNLTGTSDASVTLSGLKRTITGFTYDKGFAGTTTSATMPDATTAVTETTILPDGSRVISLYYNRNTYNVSYAYAGEVPTGAPVVPAGATYEYGATVPAADVPTLEGYTFHGWTSEVTTMPANNVSVTGYWTINSYTLTINYQYTNGTTAATTHTESVNYHAGYSVTSPTITGYTPDQSTVSGTMGTDNVSVTVTYAINTYTLTLASGGNGSAAVKTPIPTGVTDNHNGTYTINHGTVLQIEASPADHYHFVKWNDNNTDNPRTLTVTKDSSFTASFAIDTYTLNLVANGNGTVVIPEPLPAGVTGSNGTYTVNYGTNVTVTATPATHHYMQKWNDEDPINSNVPVNKTVTVTENTTLTAYFAQKPILTLTTNPSNPTRGTVTIAGTTPPNSAEQIGTSTSYYVNYGASVTVVATPDPHYHLASWNNTGGNDPQQVVTVTQDMVITGVFAIDTFTLTLQTNDIAMGKAEVTNHSDNPAIVSHDPDANGTRTYKVNYGAEVIIKATPEDHYHLESWSNGATVNTDDNIHVIVTSDSTITANFAPYPTLTLMADGNGTVTLGGINVETFNDFYHDQNEYTGEHFKLDVYVGDYYDNGFTIYYSNFVQLRDHRATITSLSDMIITKVELTQGSENIQGFTVGLDHLYVDHGTISIDDNVATITGINATSLTIGANLNCYAKISKVKVYYYDGTLPDGITENPAGGYYCAPNTQVTVKAIPDEHNHLTGWSNTTGTASQQTVTVTKDSSITAHFALDQYEVNTSVTGDHGTVSPSSQMVNQGSTATFTAHPDEGYHAVWPDNSTDNTYTTGTITSATTVNVTFAINQYEVNASVTGGHGTVSPNSQTVDHGNTATFTAHPDEGYHAVWPDNSTANTYTTGTITSATTVNVTFAINTYTIAATVSPANSGSVNGAGTYNHGETATLTAIPTTGYHFVNWTKGGTPVCTTATYSFTVTNDSSFVANFAINTYTIAATVSPENSGSVNGAGSYNHGATATLTATPATGYHFVNWTKGGTPVCTTATYTFTVTNDSSFVANFAINTYTLTLTPDGEGTVTTVLPADGVTSNGNGTYTVNYGTTVTVNATAAQLHHVAGWSDEEQNNLSAVATYSDYAVTNPDRFPAKSSINVTVTGDTTMMATFGINSYEVNASVANTTDVRGTVKIDYTDANNQPQTTGAAATVQATALGGSTTTLIAIPAAGYHFVNWTNGNAVLGTNDTLTTTEALTAIANFDTTHANLAWSAEEFSGYTRIDFNTWKPTLTNPHSVNVRYGCAEGTDFQNGGIEVDATTGVIGFDAPQFGHIAMYHGTYHIYAVHETDQNYYYDSVVYTLHVLPSALVGVSKNIPEGGSTFMPDATAEHSLKHFYAANAINGTDPPYVYMALDDSVRILAEPAVGYHFSHWKIPGKTNPVTTLAYTCHFIVPNSEEIDVIPLTVRAFFAPDTFTITYMDGETELNVDTFYYHQPITDYTVSKVGWDFLGWSPEVPEVMPAGNLTVYAQWYRICDSVTDVDHNTYPSVNINNKCWMAANLRTTHYADGRDITNLYEYTSFLYPNTAENVSIYGRLYDWYDAMDATRPTKAAQVQGICPAGWRMPTQEDFAALDTTDLLNMRSTNFWVVNDGNNSTGFDMRGSGMYNIDDARYEELLCKAYFWTANGTSATEAHCREASYFCNTFLDLIRNKENAFSVRCVKD